jgi:hypothetical protein
MAEKKTTKASTSQTKKTQAKKATTKMKKFSGDILRGDYDEEFLKRNNLLGRTCKRKMRYWCFRIRHSIIENKPMPAYPKGLKEFVESLPGFAGWKYFAVSWDIVGTNPFMIVLRLQSVWEEWDQVMNRVAIPIDSPPEQINARIQALTDEYAKKQAKRK